MAGIRRRILYSEVPHLNKVERFLLSRQRIHNGAILYTDVKTRNAVEALRGKRIPFDRGGLKASIWREANKGIDMKTYEERNKEFIYGRS